MRHGARAGWNCRGRFICKENPSPKWTVVMFYVLHNNLVGPWPVGFLIY